ncbi:hypothetical protein TIFTF001_020102 [Ficus carica]|uniref:Uncharacterized protein n=1 Tax=Ficus carica TaxID=3494 RepID=A0AA88D9I6_FICCA|nr:hypothetical protein TIFTF001_020102 [Ficus carica]
MTSPRSPAEHDLPPATAILVQPSSPRSADLDGNSNAADVKTSKSEFSDHQEDASDK